VSQCSPCAPRTSRRGRNPAYGAGLPRVTRGGPAGQTNPQVRGGNRNHNDKQNCNQNDSRLSNKIAEYTGPGLSGAGGLAPTTGG